MVMKMNVKYITALFVAIGVLGAGSALAFMNQAKYDPEIHNQVMDALESGDYNQWKTVMEENNLPMRGLNEKITEENFSKFQELHNAMISGDYEAANKIRQELGLGYGQIDTPKMRGMKGSGLGGPMGHMNRNMYFEDKNGDGVCNYQDISE